MVSTVPYPNYYCAGRNTTRSRGIRWRINKQHESLYYAADLVLLAAEMGDMQKKIGDLA